ncbi:MBL fold metallo-hydrolase [Rhodovulum sp. DZ06]|uniref:MBL fold metallo-hydrolase n=1 Tax=Rhodovulum sp. DZ06 TaxID=3425126 RepID=UPI003D33F039
MTFAPTRRDLLRLAAMAPALALPTPFRAAAAAAAQNDGWFRFTLGDAEITICSDGNLVTPASTLGVNADPAEVEAFLRAHRLPTDINYAHTNHVIVRMGDKVTLVDVGSGVKFQASAGRLLANMEAAGFGPGDISDVALTHAHPDHVWGAFDDFDEPLIPDTAHHIGAAEHGWWMDDTLLSRLPEEMHGFVAGAQNTLGPLGDLDLLQMTANEAEISPGVQMIDTPGHTMGHMSVIVESAGRKMLVTGDALNHGYVSFEHPEWHFGFDTDRELAVQSRLALLNRAADEEMVVVGYHFPFPGVGHVVRDGGKFRFLPALWRWSE